MTPLTLLPLGLTVFGLLLMAIGGGYFIRKGNYKPTIELLEKLLATYKEAVLVGQQELATAKEQNTLLTASLARAGEELRAECTRSAKQDRQMADMTMEIRALKARITDLEAQLQAVQARQARVPRAQARHPRDPAP